MFFYEELLRAFQKKQINYILVGGIAVNLHGGMRNTADMDILVEMSDDNLKELVTILKNQGYQVKQPVDPIQIADKETRQDWITNKHMKAFNFYKDDELKEVDIIIESPISFGQAIKNAEFIIVDDLKLPVISIKDLIKMKSITGRAIDKLDIDELKTIQKLRDEL